VTTLPVGCSDDAAGANTNTDASTDTSTGDTGSDVASDVAEDTAAQDTPGDRGTEDDPDVAPDVAQEVGEDTAEDPAGPEDTSDTSPDAGAPVMQACDDDTPCPDGYDCVQGVCTLVPSGRVYVENNYQLLRPTPLTGVVSFFKGFFTDLGFFMTSMGPIEGANIEVSYGGADRVVNRDEEPDQWRWQLPERIPTFTISRQTEDVDPLQSNTWVSEVFDYRLVALYGEEPRAQIGFEAKNTVVTMRFSEDLTMIIYGTIRGFLTREEAELRFLDIADNCLLQQGVCPAVDCENAPLQTLADILDCNEVEPDADIDDEVDGNDAYTTEVFFTSDVVELVE
jgi:hypothetical protein